MWQYLVVGILVAFSGGWLAYSIYKSATGKGACGGCTRCADRQRLSCGTGSDEGGRGRG